MKSSNRRLAASGRSRWPRLAAPNPARARRTAAAVRLARAGFGAASLGQRLLPEAAKRRLEDFNHDLGRRTLKLGLGKDPARWGFKAMA